MRRTATMLAGLVILLTLGATAQENRSEISLQGTGFFTQDTSEASPQTDERVVRCRCRRMAPVACIELGMVNHSR